MHIKHIVAYKVWRTYGKILKKILSADEIDAIIDSDWS